MSPPYRENEYHNLKPKSNVDNSYASTHSSIMSYLCPLLALSGIYVFGTSFFLAKKSMPHKSPCQTHLLIQTVGLSSQDLIRLTREGILAAHTDGDRSDGCWMKRRVDAIAVVVVDALRFNFALNRLPQSVGARIRKVDGSGVTRSRLFKFVADPPTVTMQRLKALTTGGLPTFADISGSFGGANVDEDSWVEQLKTVPQDQRGLKHEQDGRGGKIAFVGDDTWVDLFPNLFDDSHPYPSFNTRDLDTVDDGCMKHLPRLLKSWEEDTKKSDFEEGRKDFFEVIVAHFLGVDHVGHTYGPHNQYMTAKLHQIDDALSTVLSKIDVSTQKCLVAFVFGDHGMTEDGNHGGGTSDETNAALFAHFSPGCGDLGPSMNITGSEVGLRSEKAFQTINQIDLVPTISLLLGLPIPFANLGGLVPTLFPSNKMEKRENSEEKTPKSAESLMMATALALNAAQVWNYLKTYSNTAYALPAQELSDLESLFLEASRTYKLALEYDGNDSIAYREACGLFKFFLSEAITLGKQVWTRFDTTGMGVGIFLMVTGLLLSFPSWNLLTSRCTTLRSRQKYVTKQRSALTYNHIEIGVTIFFMIYQCAVLTFSNSYIDSEKEIIMFFLAILCTMTTTYQVLFTFANKGNVNSIYSLKVLLPFAIAFTSRVHSLLISGHGLDPMIRGHIAHHSAFFLFSLTVLGIIRLMLFPCNIYARKLSHSTIIDLCSLAFLGFSWCEKRIDDRNRNGYLTSCFSLVLCCTSIVNELINNRSNGIEILFKIMIFIMVVTGPSSASSSVLFLFQAWALSKIITLSGPYKLSDPLMAALWRLVTRQAFYLTGHACSFNRLQLSAAFAATETFYFTSAGISLFFNTFGWEFLGTALLINQLKHSHDSKRPYVWYWFYFYQILEVVGACISVTLMRRHLMVWAVFAPRFVFAGAFSIITLVCWLPQLLLNKKKPLY